MTGLLYILLFSYILYSWRICRVFISAFDEHLPWCAGYARGPGLSPHLTAQP